MATTPLPRHNRGFQALVSPQQWNALIAQGSLRKFETGAPLLHQGGPSRVVHALLAGRVRVSYTEADGNEVLVAIRGPGDLIGEYAQRDRSEHMATVWTIEGCVTTAISADIFDDVLQHQGLESVLQQYILHKYRQIPQRLWRAANLQTEQRMAQLLMEILNADPSAGPTIPMTQQQIADALGVSRSSITRLLAHWRHADLVRVGQPGLEVIDRAAIARRGERT
jgi:CRP/FNR family transcriptional regulator, cyclic AMP receptor protein